MRGFLVAMALQGLLFAGLSGPALAQGWESPARGSALRADLLDALRPMVEWDLGAPVEFVVHEMRVQGDLAFAMLVAQRPGGGEIDLARTPMVARGDFDPELAEVGAGVQALWVRSGRMWVAKHHAVGATDVWYSWEPICAEFRSIIPEACNGM